MCAFRKFVPYNHSMIIISTLQMRKLRLRVRNLFKVTQLVSGGVGIGTHIWPQIPDL